MIMKEIGGKIRLGYRITQWEWQAWKTEEGLWVNGADIIQDIIFTVYRHNKKERVNNVIMELVAR